MKLFLTLIISVLAIQSYSQEIPNFVNNKFIYTVPNEFMPDGVGAEGIKKLQNNSVKLHYPFYIVFVDKISATSDSSDNVLSKYINDLSKKWSESGMDAKYSQIFVLTYMPRKYRFLAGSDFEYRLNFVKDAHKPFTDIFVNYVKNNRSDITNGIIEMQNSIDSYLFTNTDPEQIKITTLNKIESARNDLNNLIGNDGKFLKYQTYTQSLTNLENKNLDDLAQINSQLTNYINEIKDKKQAEYIQNCIKYGFLAILFILLINAIRILYLKTIKINQMRSVYEKLKSDRKEKLDNAYKKYYDFISNKQNILELAKYSGLASQKYLDLTTIIDEIFCGLEAISLNLKQKNKKFNLFNSSKLEREIENFDEAFEFNTNQINEKDLFDPINKTIFISPPDFMKKLNDKFNFLISELDSINEALTESKNPNKFEEIAKKYDESLNIIIKNGLNSSLLSEWPQIDSTLEELRSIQPIEYYQHIKQINKTADTIHENILKTVEHIKYLKNIKLPNPEHSLQLPNEINPVLTHKIINEKINQFINEIKNCQDYNYILNQYSEIITQIDLLKTQIKFAKEVKSNADRLYNKAVKNFDILWNLILESSNLNNPTKETSLLEKSKKISMELDNLFNSIENDPENLYKKYSISLKINELIDEGTENIKEYKLYIEDQNSKKEKYFKLKKKIGDRAEQIGYNKDYYGKYLDSNNNQYLDYGVLLLQLAQFEKELDIFEEQNQAPNYSEYSSSSYSSSSLSSDSSSSYSSNSDSGSSYSSSSSSSDSGGSYDSGSSSDSGGSW